MKTLLLLLIVIVLGTVASCESPSQRSYKLRTTYESVVILNQDTVSPISKANSTRYYCYKVQRLSPRVVTYVNIKGLYEVNDTVMVTKEMLLP